MKKKSAFRKLQETPKHRTRDNYTLNFQPVPSNQRFNQKPNRFKLASKIIVTKKKVIRQKKLVH